MNKKKKKTQKKTQKKIDENELLQVIDTITKKLAYKFKFGYHDIEDMKQQISIFALEGIKNYDHKRPLENFLWTHVRNRLFNYKRDNYQRPDKPCYTCPLYEKISKNCTKYSDKNNCELFSSWSERNSNKKRLMHLTTIDEIKNYGNIFSDTLLSHENQEIIAILDEKLSGDIRLIYLKLKGGDKINKQDQIKLYNKIKEILCLKKEDN
jgi:DNA-directed RNA polymerase specialized sigma24 family protein